MKKVIIPTGYNQETHKWDKLPELNNVYDMCKLLYYADDTVFSWKHFSEDKYNTIGFGAIRPTGKFDGNFDYNRGIMCLRIYTFITPCQKGNHTYSARVLITNVDDGVWDANSKEFDNAADANKLTQAVYDGYREFERTHYGKSLPTEKELNDVLMVHGLWGEFTG